MENLWRQIMPQTKFRLISTSGMFNNYREILDLLYQPILGNNAYALINIFWQMNNHNYFKVKYHSHFELLKLLNIGIQSFYKARKKLEGTGLLKTLIKPGNEPSSNIYIYELIPPASFHQFFKDDLLSLELLEIVGETHYKNLINTLFPKIPKFDGFKDITQNFLDVFQVSSKKITQHSKISNFNHKNNSKISNLKQDDASSGFDFKMLLNILSSSYVNIQSVKKAHQLIIDINNLYGIDEIEMSKLIERSTNITTNFFDANKLKITVSRMFQNFNNRKFDLKFNNEKNNDKHFSNNERQLILSAKEYAPIEFLMALKENKNGIVSSNEKFTVKQGVEQSPLTTSVINILIYQILINKNYSSLKRSYFNSIVDDWSQNQINSPEKAIKYIQKREDDELESHHHKYSYHNSKPRIKESLPDWAKDDYHPEYKKASLATRKRVKEKLKRLNRDMKEGK